MIVKGQPANTNEPEQATSSSLESPPPPSYGQSIQPFPVVVLRRESPMRRFCQAFFVAVLIWLLMSLLVRSFVDVTRWNRSDWVGDFPVPLGVTLSRCAIGEQWSNEYLSAHPSAQDTFPPSSPSYSSETSFELPLTYDTLFILSRGSQSYGIVNTITSKTKSHVAKVHLTVWYADKNVRDMGTKVCLVKGGNNRIGVGIFTRRWRGRNPAQHALYFQATVVLPAADVGKPLQLINFETDVPNSSQHIADIQGLVDFRYISLKSSNGQIHVKSVHADTININTSNSVIEGTFNASRSLRLETSNAPILVDVGLHSDQPHVSELIMRTSNSKLQANVSLTSSSSEGGKYLVTTSTSNGPLHIDFPASPIDSVLRFQASTSNSPAWVSLHPAYEGTFSLTTSLFSPLVKRREVDDPSGKGRKRFLETSISSPGNLKGSVAWSEHKGPSSAVVRTSNSPVTIEL